MAQGAACGAPEQSRRRVGAGDGGAGRRAGAVGDRRPRSAGSSGRRAMMTSLDMQRLLAVAVCRVDAGDDGGADARRRRSAPGPACAARVGRGRADLPDGLTPIRPMPSDHAATRAFLARCCEILIAAEADLNALDAKSGDGDTGSTLATAARALIAGARPPAAGRPDPALPRHRAGAEPDHGRVLRRAAGDLLRRRRRCRGLERADDGSARWPRPAWRGCRRSVVPRPGDRTMVDALEPASGGAGRRPGGGAAAARGGADRDGRDPARQGGTGSYLSAPTSLPATTTPAPRPSRGCSPISPDSRRSEAVARLFAHLAGQPAI